MTSFLVTIEFYIRQISKCSVLNKLTLLKFEIHMEELKKKYTPYTESERMSYIREYLSTSETKYQFAKRTGICRRLLILWLEKYHINDKVMNTEQPSLSKASDESLNELEKELAALRAENRKLQRALQEESLRHEACEELINLAESTYHIKVRKNSIYGGNRICTVCCKSGSNACRSVFGKNVWRRRIYRRTRR